MKIGLIADTHGLLRPEALVALQGCDHLIHAGDIGKPEILAQLQAIAPLSAVRGNNDQGPWAEDLPERLLLKFGRTTFYVLHDLAELDIDPLAHGIAVVVAGHSHKPRLEQHHGVLYINPGSAGPRRFSLPIGLGFVHLQQGRLRPELIELTP
ncbi:MAG: YfcE family phosphodiesterase [Pseudomonadales bacterium RIFCSPLOWO2_02_FULL_63_210]|nr:MAG: YfcE family phosphodiesterase [Pseudomonadales bacterium RIFCSPLOWO2_02_FULL_63_210]